MARIGPFSNVDRFMIIQKPQKLFFPTFVSDYNNPKRYRNKDMKVNLNKGAIEGLSLEQGSSFLLLPLHDYRELFWTSMLISTRSSMKCCSPVNVTFDVPGLGRNYNKPVV